MIRRMLVGGLAAIQLLGSTPLLAAAQDGDDVSTGSEGAAFLLLPVGAKGVSLGRAVTALSGPESVWWNPAGLAGLEESRVMLLRGEDLAGELTALSVLLPKRGLGILGVSYQLSDLGESLFTDRQGNVLGTIFVRNHVGVLSLASELVDALAVGVNLKLIQQRWTCRGQCPDGGVSSTTVALDAGFQWRDALGLPLRLAASLAHAGPRVQFINEGQADPLPTRVRVAAAYDVLSHFVEGGELRALVTVELEDRWRDLGSPATYVGAELGAGTTQALFVRAGYVFGAALQVDGAGVGVGLRYDRLELGIGKSLASTALSGEAEPVHVTLGFVF
jgi:hypothetical protein